MAYTYKSGLERFTVEFLIESWKVFIFKMVKNNTKRYVSARLLYWTAYLEFYVVNK